MLADGETNFFIHFLLVLLRIVAEQPSIEVVQALTFMCDVEDDAKLDRDGNTFLVRRVRRRVRPYLQI